MWPRTAFPVPAPVVRRHAIAILKQDAGEPVGSPVLLVGEVGSI